MHSLSEVIRVAMNFFDPTTAPFFVGKPTRLKHKTLYVGKPTRLKRTTLYVGQPTQSEDLYLCNLKSFARATDFV